MMVICENVTVDCPQRCPHRSPHLPCPLGEECDTIPIPRECGYKSGRFRCREIVEWARGARLVIEDGKAHFIKIEDVRPAEEQGE